RPDEGVDSRLLVVEATEEDINRFGYPLSDGILAETIEVIKEHEPSTIGLLFFRNEPREPGHQKLLSLLQNDDNLVALCNVRLSKDDPNQPGIASAPGLTEESLGFSNIELDQFDGILRRSFLFMNPDSDNPCATRFSFSFQLAYKYLSSVGIELETINRNLVKLGEVEFKRLQTNTGAYQNLDNGGFQILLNYRSSRNAASTISLNEVLENNFNPELIKGRIVIIGMVAPIATDSFSTSYSKGILPQMSGVNIQAQMTSQILSAALDKRPLLWTLSTTGEMFWVIIWSLAGSGITIICLRGSFIDALSKPHSFLLFIYTGFGILTLYIACFAFLLLGGWLPLVPGIISLSVSSIGGWFLLRHWKGLGSNK
ncbi:MAG: CHASE2 domain-containing protein, partial [Spirulinaceae cyanobacterium]